jgi:hypothetical protein
MERCLEMSFAANFGFLGFEAGIRGLRRIGQRLEFHFS